MKIRLKQKFWLYSIACVALLPAVMFVSAVYFYHQLPSGVRQACQEIFIAHLPVLLLVCLVLLLCLMILINEVFHSFILPLDRLREELRLITTVRSSHRIAVKGAKEVRQLADGINKAAELIGALQQQSLRPHEQTGREKEIRQERDFLGGLLTEIPGGVVAANEAGRIFFYTKTAADLVDIMQDAAYGSAPGPPVGLDRCIFSVLAGQIGFSETSRFNNDFLVPESGALRPPVQISFEHRGVRGRFFKIAARSNAKSYYLVFLHPAADDLTGQLPVSAPGSGRKKASDFPYYDLDLLNNRQRGGEDAGDRQLAELTYTVFDLETTGLDPAGGDEIISIGAVRIVNGRILFEETFYQMVNPVKSIPEPATKIHGIAGSMLMGQPGIDTVMPEFCRYFEDSVLVCHCAELDFRFIGAHARKAGIRIDNPILDTFDLSQLVQPSQTDHCLESIAARLGTKVYDRHIAYGDAWTTAEILLKLIELLAAKGIHSLGQARETRMDHLASVR